MQLIESAKIPQQCAFTTEKAIYIKPNNMKLLKFALVVQTPTKKSLWNSTKVIMRCICFSPSAVLGGERWDGG